MNKLAQWELEKRNLFAPAPLLVGIELNPGPQLTKDKRQKIIWYKQDAGLSIPQICAKLDIKSPNTVRKWLRRNKQNLSLNNLRGQGRKRKLTSRQESQLVKKAKKGADAPELSRQLSKKVEGGVTARTVRRVLRRRGLKYLVIEKREAITPAQAAKRLKFAQDRKDYDWKYAVFTDEKTFHVGTSKHKGWQDPSDKKIEETKRYTKKINVWGGIGLHFKTKLYFFEENLDAKLYCKILKSRLPPAESFNLDPYSRSNWVLVQDNDPKHTAEESVRVLDILAPKRLRDWAPNSPDFNILEDVWSWLDDAMKHKNIKTIASLKRNLSLAWKNLDMSKVQASIQSIPHRLEECIQRQGKRTSY
jgi:transposase